MKAGQPKTVGVLGGLGPEATLDFFARVLKRSQASREQARPRLLIDNNPQVPDRNEALAGTGPSPGPALAEMARGLEKAGADFLVMVCNTAHAFQDDVLRATTLPFVSLIEETVRATLARLPQAHTVGLLATRGCLAAQLYQRAFAARHIRVLEPEGQGLERFMTLLYRIKAGDLGAEVQSEMRALALAFGDQGAEAIVAGCTEVPLVLSQERLELPFLSSTDALVEATLAYALGSRALPERSTV